MFSIGAAVLPLVASQFVPQPSDLITKQGYAGVNVRYKEVPTGICELNPSVKSFTGYADVEENQHIFWWFFEARNVDPTTAPLTVWINGGPGASSMIGLFQELGPCYIDSDLNPYSNPYSWTNVSNFLFIDQPNQVGFSYSTPVPGYVDTLDDEERIVTLPNSCPDYAAAFGNCGTYSYANVSETATGTPNAAPNFWKTLQGFFGAFPQYSRHSFHVTTESYGGHYGPVFSEYIEQQNDKNISGATEIHLETLALGNGWFNPTIQYPIYWNYTVDPGNTYDFDPYNESTKAQLWNAIYGAGNCYDRLKDCDSRSIDDACQEASRFCAYKVESLLDDVPGRDEYDIRELNPDPFPPNFFSDYLNLPHVQQAIGAYVNYSESSYEVSPSGTFGITGDDAREVNSVQDLQSLLKRGIYFLQYTGDADYNCNWLGGQVVADEIDAPGYSSAGFSNITTDDGIVHGVVKQAGNYAFVRVYFSGHEVPFYQPVLALALFNRTLHKVDIATGLHAVSSGLRTEGPATSDFREGNATMQYEVIPTNCTYNLTTHEPNACTASTSHSRSNSERAASTTSKNKSKKHRRASRRSILRHLQRPTQRYQ
ncbi:MAG: hypothetical protein M1821_006671 [Bathelium mastoideum]|nr:MAG: hypothetical protein M1821_006671 [Bathelium mastoideum]